MTPPPPPRPFNPYAAPLAPESQLTAAAPRARVPGDEIKWVFTAFAGAAVLLRFVGYRWQHLGLTRQSRDSVELIAQGAAFLAAMAIYGWTYAAWSTVPHRNLVKNTALGAVVRTILPNAYWHIVLQLRLCSGIDTALEELGAPPSAPKALGVVAGATLLLPYVLLLLDARLGSYGGVIASVAWFFYMFDCDASRRVLLEMLASRRADAEQKLVLAAADAAAQGSPLA
jgi:hypothetical protein